MTGITYLNRLTGASNNLVYLETSDTTSTAVAAGYITAQASNINSITEGGWTWEANDCIMLSASDGINWCGINSTFTSLIQFASDVNSPSNLLQQATFTLTETQVNGMYAAPVQVLAAQGAGTLILPQLVTLELIYAAAVTGGTSANIGFQYGNTVHLGGVGATNVEQGSDLTGASANTWFNFITATGNASQLLKSSVANTGLFISNTAAAFTGGSGNTYNGTIYYRVVSIS